jgi:hypothetical protein
MDASVFVDDNGTLIIRTYNINKRSHWRNVEFFISNNILTVIGDKVNWGWQDEPEISEFIAEHQSVDKVLPEYIETYTYKPKRGFFTYGSKCKTEERTRVKAGWVELKDTNIPMKIITSNFIIYEKK